MTLYSDVNSNDVHGKLEASTADFNLFEKALIFAENSGLEQISGRMGSTDRNGDLSGACILGQFTEHYRQGSDPDANWTYRRGMYDTYGNGLPLMVRQAYGLSSENLLVDLRRLEPALHAKLENALSGVTLKGPVVNITALNDSGVPTRLLTQVLRQCLTPAH